MDKSSVLSIMILSSKEGLESQILRCIDFNLLSDKTCRLFAVWCYRDTLNWIKNPDPRSIAAADVAERYALGNATQDELSAAASAAWSAESAESAESAASAAWSAARSAAWSAESAAASVAENRQRRSLIRLIKEELNIT